MKYVQADFIEAQVRIRNSTYGQILFVDTLHSGHNDTYGHRPGNSPPELLAPLCRSLFKRGLSVYITKRSSVTFTV